jgi:hypothetical protein
VVKCSRDLRGLHWIEGDLVPEGSKLADESGRVTGGVVSVDEVVSTEIGVALSPVEHVVGGNEDGMPDGDGGLARSSSALEASVLGGEVGTLGPSRSLRCLRCGATWTPCGSCRISACLRTRCGPGTSRPRRPGGPRSRTWTYARRSRR